MIGCSNCVMARQSWNGALRTNSAESRPESAPRPGPLGARVVSEEAARRPRGLAKRPLGVRLAPAPRSLASKAIAGAVVAWAGLPGRGSRVGRATGAAKRPGKAGGVEISPGRLGED